MKQQALFRGEIVRDPVVIKAYLANLIRILKGEVK